MRSILFRPTGRFVQPGEQVELKPHETVRNNEIHVAEELPDRRLNGLSLFKGGDQRAGLDLRQNAVGDTADVATGYQVAIDTLTFRVQKIVEQKFYTAAPADFIPVRVGQGAFSASLLTPRTYAVSDEFEAGNIRTGAADARRSMSDVAMDTVTQPVMNWLKGVEYTIFDVETALRANNWDVIVAKHKARKKNWDLGIQEIAFLGSKVDANFPGLLTVSAINTNTSLITKKISTMNAAELQTFVAGLVAAYFSNTNSTALPNRFVIPYQDYLGLTQLTTGTVGTYPVPLIEYLEKAFKMAVSPMEKDFKIMPLAYCDAAVNNAARGINKNIYMLYRDDEDSLRMDIPVDFTVTQPNSPDNFTFHDAAYGQYTGIALFRNLEVLKFQF